MITLDNYEIYFADFMANTLSPEELHEMNAFLLLHPELRVLLEEANMAVLVKPTVTFALKNKLKKDEIDEYEDYYAIAMLEEVLTDDEQTTLAKTRDSKSFKKTLDAYRSIKFMPDHSIHFEHKNRLYKKSHVRIGIIQATAVAAGLLLLAGIGLILFESPTQTFQSGLSHPEMQHAAIEYPKIVPIPPKTEVIDNEIPQQTVSHTPYAESPTIHFQKSKVITAISVPIAAVEWKQTVQPIAKIEQQQLSTQCESEIILTEGAETWKPSASENFQSKNIFTSVINLGKDITEKIKNKEFSHEIQKSW